MCILFVHQNTDEDGQYKLIFAANRDESFNRPAKPVDFHPEFSDVLCGIDMEPGVEGGTWLGISKGGKFAALTNVLVENEELSKSARGRLVIDYLKGGKKPMEYLQSLQNENHRKYNLLAGLVDSSGKVKVAFHSNCDGQEPRLLHDGNTVVACTALDGKWRKMVHGRQKFEAILSKTENDPNHEHLTECLLDSLLSDTTTLYPDVDIKAQCKERLSEEVLAKYCSIKIAGLPGYGTRMQTVILIDKNNVVHFTERTLGAAGSKKYFSFVIR